MKRSLISAAALLVLTISTAIFIAKHNYASPVAQLPSPSLKDLASQHGLEIGNFAIASKLHELPYKSILTSQFNVALIDNTPNWYFTDGGLRPSASTYNFKQFDQLVSFAESHNMTVQAHHFVWGEEKWLPGWLKNGNYTPSQLEEIIHDHIANVGGHYKGRVKEWTVVNEAFTRGAHINGLRDWWADNTGGSTDYIDKSFIWARQADPDAKLILNDFGNEGLNTTSNTMYDYIKAAKSRGVPIDGIGMQMHIDGSHPPQKDEVIANMKRFKAIGVDTYVTEFDVNMHDVKADPKDRDQIQGSIYYEMLRACIESDACPSFSLLGVTDSETWYSYIGIADANPLPFDNKYQPKPAFYSLRQALLQP